MDYEIKIKDVPLQKVATIRSKVPLAALGRFVPESLGKIVQALGKSGVAPIGMPFVVYHTMDPSLPLWDVQVCFPISQPFAGAGDVTPDTVAGGTMAFTLHRGPYDDVPRAYDAVKAYVQREHRRFAGPPREAYLNDPRVVGMENAETEIDWPVA